MGFSSLYHIGLLTDAYLQYMKSQEQKLTEDILGISKISTDNLIPCKFLQLRKMQKFQQHSNSLSSLCPIVTNYLNKCLQ